MDCKAEIHYEHNGLTGLKNQTKIKIEQFAPVEDDPEDAKNKKKKKVRLDSDGEIEENDEMRRIRE